MQYLKEFEWKISLVDGLLIETGGKFRKNNYIDSCIETAQKYYQEKKDKQALLKIVDSYILFYKNETSWKYYNDEMQFLNTLKTTIEQLF